jgi:uncharacterized caspase-like protein
MSRTAVLIGINQYPAAPLNGCLADVTRLTLLLAGFDRIQVLLDDRATFDSIREAWTNAAHAAQPGDVLVLAFSGHGSIVPLGRTESGFPTHLDQCICPYDYDAHWTAPFDDGVFRQCVKGIRDRVALYLLLDSCHSGGGFRELQPPKEDLPRFARPPRTIDPAPWPLPINRFGVKQISGYLNVDQTMKHLVYAACRSDQTAADASFAEGPGGAFTTAFDKAMKDNPGVTNLQIVEATNQNLLRWSFSQVAQIEGSARLINAYPFTVPDPDDQPTP